MGQSLAFNQPSHLKHFSNAFTQEFIDSQDHSEFYSNVNLDSFIGTIKRQKVLFSGKKDETEVIPRIQELESSIGDIVFLLLITGTEFDVDRCNKLISCLKHSDEIKSTKPVFEKDINLYSYLATLARLMNSQKFQNM